MMGRLLPPGRALTAVATLVLAAAAASVALVRASRLDPLPPAVPVAPSLLPDGGLWSRGAGDGPPGPGAPTVDVELDNDPFDPERRLPGDYEVVEYVAAEPPPMAAELVRLLGTVVLPNGGGFAVYQLPSEIPRTVRIGETVGTMTLVGVSPGQAVFRARDGSRVELHLSTPGT